MATRDAIFLVVRTPVLANNEATVAVQGYDRLTQSIEELRHLLPIQGPIEVFIHHNTLHSFEHLDFEEAVEEAATIYGARPYLPESRYRELFLEGIIQPQDLEQELAPFLTDSSEPPAMRINRAEFRRQLLRFGLHCEDPAISQWKVSEGRLSLRSDLPQQAKGRLVHETRTWLLGLLGSGRRSLLAELNAHRPNLARISDTQIEKFIHGTNRDEKHADAITAAILWHCSGSVAQQCTVADLPSVAHHAQAVFALTGADPFDLVNPVLIQLCSMFTDQGVSHWPMPDRESGLLTVSTRLFAPRGIPVQPWLKRASRLFKELRPEQIGATETLRILLQKLGVKESELEPFLIYSGLRLKGWAGFISLLEKKPQIARDRPVKASLEDFLAVEALLTTAACEELLAPLNLTSINLDDLRAHVRLHSRVRHTESSRQAMTEKIFGLSQVLNLSPKDLVEGGGSLAEGILKEADAFPAHIRQRIWHLAFERSYLRSVLTAFGNHEVEPGLPLAPEAQVMFCIDEREESFRRHLEEINPHIETLGYPGFFNLALAYRGPDQLHAEALCPVVMEPQISVVEHDQALQPGQQSNKYKRRLGRAAQELQRLTRTPLGGSLVSATVGHFALVPFLLRLLRPAFAGQVHHALQAPHVGVSGFKISAASGETSEPALRTAVAQSLSAVFKTTGIARTAAPLVVIMGHGSSSLNNPHESAHDCGACGGRRGSPSARLFARFANDPLVRAEMRTFGVDLHSDTFVLGAYHDTCNDSITVFDENAIPHSLLGRATSVIANCREAAARNALERSRRFLSSRKAKSPEQAAARLLHRAEDLSEPRPEYGHATNAMAFIGRRARCKGLFLDRRAFLSSYDPTQDSDGSILQSLLAAVVPVCAGINLEYYFSMVDSTNYGCGTKLPHNIVGQIGVMDGAASDLRTGLPWQMVEIHEPVRLVMMVETSPQRLENVLSNLPKVKNLVEKRWLWLVAVDPHKPEFWLYKRGSFQPYPIEQARLPRIADSLAYCVHTSRPLPFASVGDLSRNSVSG